MDLASKFKEASACNVLRIDQMFLDQEYSITIVAKLITGYSGSVIFFLRNIRQASEQLYKVYLPIQYADVLCDSDMEDINDDKVWLNLVYRGMSKDRSPILEIT